MEGRGYNGYGRSSKQRKQICKDVDKRAVFDQEDEGSNSSKCNRGNMKWGNKDEAKEITKGQAYDP